ncbi:hypothetical protein ACLOJK_018902 [Asimina triloba]
MHCMCTKFHRQPEHQIRCSITVKGGSHSCRLTYFRRHVNRPIRSGQKLRKDMLNLVPPTSNIHSSVFTVEVVSRGGSIFSGNDQQRQAMANRASTGILSSSIQI